jgi:hypothetical protein
MIRHVLAAVVVVCLCPHPVVAQTPVLTIDAASADVYKAPTVASPILGHAPRGRVLEVTREVGDWVKVSWPDAADGIGYVRLVMGSLSRSATLPSHAVTSTSSAPPTGANGLRSSVDGRTAVPAGRSGAAYNQAGSEYVAPPAHTVGIGGLMNGRTIGYGISSRMWSRRRLGVQLELSRYSLTTPGTDRVTSLQFVPSVLYSLRSRVTEYMWIRPYLGGGARLSRFTLNNTATAVPSSENRRSWQGFGGTELTFPNAPRVALSADLRYDSSDTPFAGFEFGGLGFSLSGHWYFK